MVMQKTPCRYIKLICTAFVAATVCHVQEGRAGWNGTMNGSGYGQASVNVRAADTSLLKKKTITSINMQDPSASMAPTTGYATNSVLPTDASAATVAKIKGATGYVWVAETVG